MKSFDVVGGNDQMLSGGPWHPLTGGQSELPLTATRGESLTTLCFPGALPRVSIVDVCWQKGLNAYSTEPGFFKLYSKGVAQLYE